MAVQKANKKLVLLNQLVKRERKGLPQGQNSWQEGCLFVWGEEGKKKRVGKSSPPGAVNTQSLLFLRQLLPKTGSKRKPETLWRHIGGSPAGA